MDQTVLSATLRTPHHPLSCSLGLTFLPFLEVKTCQSASILPCVTRKASTSHLNLLAQSSDVFLLWMKTEKEKQSDKRQMHQEMALAGFKDGTIYIYCSVQCSLPLRAWLKMRTSRRRGKIGELPLVVLRAAAVFDRKGSIFARCFWN